MTVDLTKSIVAKSDQLNADDLLGGPITIKIAKVSLAASGEQPIAINYDGDQNKPFFPCKTVRRILVHVWGSDGASYVGKSMTLFRDPEVTYGGQKVGGIRVSHMSHMDKAVTLSLTATSKSKKPFTVKPLTAVATVATVQPSTPTPPQPEKSEIIQGALEAAGALYASQGVSAYKNWLAGLTTEQKAAIKGYHGEWSKVAKDADGG